MNSINFTLYRYEKQNLNESHQTIASSAGYAYLRKRVYFYSEMLSFSKNLPLL